MKSNCFNKKSRIWLRVSQQQIHHHCPCDISITTIIVIPMNRYSRLASKWGYYRYLLNYTPGQLNKYQSGFNYEMGRAGLYHILVYRFAAIHNTLEERISAKLVTPTVVTNIVQRLTMYWFLMGAMVFSFFLGDMGSVMNPTRVSSVNRIADDGQIPMRYESLYLHDKTRRSI